MKKKSFIRFRFWKHTLKSKSKKSLKRLTFLDTNYPDISSSCYQANSGGEASSRKVCPAQWSRLDPSTWETASVFAWSAPNSSLPSCYIMTQPDSRPLGLAGPPSEVYEVYFLSYWCGAWPWLARWQPGGAGMVLQTPHAAGPAVSLWSAERRTWFQTGDM